MPRAAAANKAPNKARANREDEPLLDRMEDVSEDEGDFFDPAPASEEGDGYTALRSKWRSRSTWLRYGSFVSAILSWFVAPSLASLRN